MLYAQCHLITKAKVNVTDLIMFRCMDSREEATFIRLCFPYIIHNWCGWAFQKRKSIVFCKAHLHRKLIDWYTKIAWRDQGTSPVIPSRYSWIYLSCRFALLCYIDLCWPKSVSGSHLSRYRRLLKTAVRLRSHTHPSLHLDFPAIVLLKDKKSKKVSQGLFRQGYLLGWAPIHSLHIIWETLEYLFF